MLRINCKGILRVWDKPIIMGIINCTPDSFYAGSTVQEDALLEFAGKMIEGGASILDLGGQSTRPGSVIHTPEVELDRLLPAIVLLSKHYPDIPLSIDTYYSAVAKAAINAGAAVINDISGGLQDPHMLTTVGSLQVPYICMHMRGNQQNMQELTQYRNVTMEVIDYFIERVAACRAAGIKDIIIDPGFGFAKDLTQNYRLMGELELLKVLDLPVLVGVSRKSMICRLLNIKPAEALNGTTVLNTIAVLKGAAILRVHDVKAAHECLRLTDYLISTTSTSNSKLS